MASTHFSDVKPRSIDAWASLNHGLITRDASGLSVDAWYRAIRTGRFEQIHPLVARLPGTARSREQAIAAAVLAAGPGAMASHRSAAYLLGIIRPDSDPVDVIVDQNRQPRRPGVRFHRPTDRAGLHPHRARGIRCTNVLRTLCDLGAVAGSDAVEAAVGHVLAQRMVSLEALEATLATHAKQGRAGVGALRSAIDAWSIDAKPADSVLELAMARLVERHRLPPVSFHERIEGWEVDFRVRGSVVLLECDGWAYHGLQRTQFERDRHRDAQLAGAGWIVVRFTYRALVSTPAATATRIRAAVDRWAHVAPPA